MAKRTHQSLQTLQPHSGKWAKPQSYGPGTSREHGNCCSDLALSRVFCHFFTAKEWQGNSSPRRLRKAAFEGGQGVISSEQQVKNEKERKGLSQFHRRRCNYTGQTPTGSQCYFSSRKRNTINFLSPEQRHLMWMSHVYINTPHRIFESSDFIFNFPPTR